MKIPDVDSDQFRESLREPLRRLWFRFAQVARDLIQKEASIAKKWPQKRRK